MIWLKALLQHRSLRILGPAFVHPIAHPTDLQPLLPTPLVLDRDLSCYLLTYVLA